MACPQSGDKGQNRKDTPTQRIHHQVLSPLPLLPPQASLRTHAQTRASGPDGNVYCPCLNPQDVNVSGQGSTVKRISLKKYYYSPRFSTLIFPLYPNLQHSIKLLIFLPSSCHCAFSTTTMQPITVILEKVILQRLVFNTHSCN